jgi:hypothetical protein
MRLRLILVGRLWLRPLLVPRAGTALSCRRVLRCCMICSGMIIVMSGIRPVGSGVIGRSTTGGSWRAFLMWLGWRLAMSSISRSRRRAMIAVIIGRCRAMVCVRPMVCVVATVVAATVGVIRRAVVVAPVMPLRVGAA